MEGYIYKITSPNNDNIYIGSTTLSLIERLNLHNYNKNRCNITSKQILESGNATIELLENIKFENRKELYQKEREYISNNKAICVNQRGKFKDDKECLSSWREKNREKIRIYDAELRKKKRELKPVKIKLTEEEIKQNKQKYQEEHKEEKKKYDEEYRQKNKEKLIEKILCECGGTYQRKHKSEHIKTKKHLNYVKKD
jgi:hypothetical protein